MTAQEDMDLSELLQKQINDYISVSLSMTPAATISFEDAIASIYHNLQLQPPVVVWCDSPTQFVLMPSLIAVLMSADGFSAKWLKEFLQRYHDDTRVMKTWKSIEKTVDVEKIFRLRTFGALLNEKLIKQITNVDSYLQDTITVSRRLQIIRELQPLTDYAERLSEACVAMAQRVLINNQDQMITDLARLLDLLPIQSPQLRFSIPGAGDARVFDRWFGPWTGERPPISTIQDFYDERMTKKSQLTTSSFNHESLSRVFPYLSRILATEVVAGFTGEPVPFDLDSWSAVFRSGLSYLFFENICFACRFPVTATIDEAKRWHNSEAPAVTMADGEHFYAWHGTPIPASIVERRNQITPRSIELQPNQELRRIMLELYGMEKYLRKSAAKIIHQDQFGTLYKKEYGRGEPLTVVEVVNSTPEPDGTNRRYLLRVPPVMETAKQAVAWSFGLTASQYEPDSES